MQVIIGTGLGYLWEVQRGSPYSYLVHKVSIAFVTLCNILFPAQCVKTVNMYESARVTLFFRGLVVLRRDIR